MVVLCAQDCSFAILVGVQPVGAQTFSFPVGGFTTSNVCKNATTPPPACQVF